MTSKDDKKHLGKGVFKVPSSMVYSIKYALFEGVDPTWKAPNLFSRSKYRLLVTSCDLWSQITNCSNPLRVGGCGGGGREEASYYLLLHLYLTAKMIDGETESPSFFSSSTAW
jgi:hypothetical protein